MAKLRALIRSRTPFATELTRTPFATMATKPEPVVIRHTRTPVATEPPGRSRNRTAVVSPQVFMRCSARSLRSSRRSGRFPGKGALLNLHQARVVKRILEPDTRGLLLYFGMGSGKTLSSIAAAEALFECMPGEVEKALVVVPASLVANYAKELRAFGATRRLYTVISYQGAAKLDPETAAKSLLVVDECHNARTPGTQAYRVVSALARRAKKVLLLTGTPVSNHPFELAALLNHIVPGLLPNDANEFEATFGATGLGRPDWLEIIVRDLVLFYNPKGYDSGEATADFPAVTFRDVFVPMAPEQAAAHLAAFKGALRSAAGVSRLIKNNSFYLHQRQLCNVHRGQHPKLDAVARAVNASFHRGEKSVVYSFFAAKGVDIVAKMLGELGVPCALFTGRESAEAKAAAIRRYNRDEIMALVISDAGAEGLDLKHTRHVHLCDPSWHASSAAQIVGRARRYGSHTDPAVRRLVEVHRYYSVYGDEYLMDATDLTTKNASADVIIRAIAERKDGVCSTFLRKVISWAR